MIFNLKKKYLLNLTCCTLRAFNTIFQLHFVLFIVSTVFLLILVGIYNYIN